MIHTLTLFVSQLQYLFYSYNLTFFSIFLFVCFKQNKLVTSLNEGYL